VTQPLKLKCDFLLSTLCFFKCNLCRYDPVIMSLIDNFENALRAHFGGFTVGEWWGLYPLNAVVTLSLKASGFGFNP
jgi:hypothetical protein